MPTASEVIGARLRARRQDRGWSVDELAAALGVSRQAIYRWERGEDTPHRERQSEVASALLSPWADLFNPAEDVA